MKPLIISLTEDNYPLAHELRELFNSQPDMLVLDVFPTAEETLRVLSSRMPEVLIVDLRLPGMSGVELIARLKQTYPNLHMLVLTMYEESDLIFNALRAGASGYLLKRSGADEICDAVRQVRGGGAPMSPSIALKVVESFRAPRNSPSNQEAKLSPREEEILSLLAEGALYKEISSALGISMDTVRTHLRRIYDKLHVHSRTQAVMKFYGQRR